MSGFQSGVGFGVGLVLSLFGLLVVAPTIFVTLLINPVLGIFLLIVAVGIVSALLRHRRPVDPWDRGGAL